MPHYIHQTWTPIELAQNIDLGDWNKKVAAALGDTSYEQWFKLGNIVRDEPNHSWFLGRGKLTAVNRAAYPLLTELPDSRVGALATELLCHISEHYQAALEQISSQVTYSGRLNTRSKARRTEVQFKAINDDWSLDEIDYLPEATKEYDLLPAKDLVTMALGISTQLYWAQLKDNWYAVSLKGEYERLYFGTLAEVEAIPLEKLTPFATFTAYFSQHFNAQHIELNLMSVEAKMCESIFRVNDPHLRRQLTQLNTELLNEQQSLSGAQNDIKTLTEQLAQAQQQLLKLNQREERLTEKLDVNAQKRNDLAIALAQSKQKVQQQATQITALQKLNRRLVNGLQAMRDRGFLRKSIDAIKSIGTDIRTIGQYIKQLNHWLWVKLGIKSPNQEVPAAATTPSPNTNPTEPAMAQAQLITPAHTLNRQVSETNTSSHTPPPRVPTRTRSLPI